MANRRRGAEKEQFWRLVLDEQRKSGLNVREFCRRESISEASFYAWRRELKERDGGDSQHAKRANTKPGKLVPVEVIVPQEIDSCADRTAATRNVEIVTPGGWLLRLASSIEPSQLGTLLDVIAGRESTTRAESVARSEPSAC